MAAALSDCRVRDYYGVPKKKEGKKEGRMSAEQLESRRQQHKHFTSGDLLPLALMMAFLSDAAVTLESGIYGFMYYEEGSNMLSFTQMHS